MAATAPFTREAHRSAQEQTALCLIIGTIILETGQLYSGADFSERSLHFPELLVCMFQDLFAKPLLLGIVPSFLLWSCTINIILNSFYRG
jgi:hypothetical protein